MGVLLAALNSVPAVKHFTINDDGLSRPWNGRVYLNPPYSYIARWTQKLLAEHESGNVHEAIALVPARVDTAWFRPFGRAVFVSGRLKFSNSENSAPFPSALLYLGQRWNNFKEQFADIGHAWVKECETEHRCKRLRQVKQVQSRRHRRKIKLACTVTDSGSCPKNGQACQK
jgi:hypothetical protein